MNFTQQNILSSTANRGQRASSFVSTSVHGSTLEQSSMNLVSERTTQLPSFGGLSQKSSAVTASQQTSSIAQGLISTSRVKSLVSLYQSSTADKIWGNSPSSHTLNSFGSSATSTIPQSDNFASTTTSATAATQSLTTSPSVTTIASSNAATSTYQFSSLHSPINPVSTTISTVSSSREGGNNESSTITSVPFTFVQATPHHSSKQTHEIQTSTKESTTIFSPNEKITINNILPPSSWTPTSVSSTPSNSSTQVPTFTSFSNVPEKLTSTAIVTDQVTSLPSLTSETDGLNMTTKSTSSYSISTQTIETFTEIENVTTSVFPPSTSILSSIQIESIIPSIRTTSRTSTTTLEPSSPRFNKVSSTPLFTSSSAISSSKFSTPSSTTHSFNSSTYPEISSTTSTSTIIKSVVYTSTIPYMVSTSENVQVYYYNQRFFFTDSSTSFLTELGVSTAITETGKSTSKFEFVVPTATVTAPVELFQHYLNTGNLDSTSSSSSPSEKGTNKDAIIGSVVGSVGGVLLCSILIWFIVKRLRRNKNNTFNHTSSFSHSRGRRYNYDTMRSDNEIEEVDPFRNEFKFDKRKDSTNANIDVSNQIGDKTPPIVPNPRKNNIVTNNNNINEHIPTTLQGVTDSLALGANGDQIRHNANIPLSPLQRNFNNNLNSNHHHERFSYASSDNGTSYNSSSGEDYSTILSSSITFPQDEENPPQGFLREVL